VGYFESPLDLPPHAYWAGCGRYDDPRREFRTLYCAPSPLTCLREKLAPFRLSLKMSEERRRLGKPTSTRVTLEWRTANALAAGRLEFREGRLIPIYEPAVRSRLEERLHDFLVSLRVSRLDLNEVQGSRRKLTQAIARLLYEEGEAGIMYQSRFDGQICCALFEGRVRLIPTEEANLLSAAIPEFEQVCEEFRLVVESKPL
jgi:hypothetical protein